MTGGGLHWVDVAIVLAYAAAMLGIGWYCHRTQSSPDEYFVGNRAMPPLLIGVSMFATLFSTISYLSTPGEIIRHGPAMMSNVLALPLVYVVVGHLMLPRYMRIRVVSAYELLEQRLGLPARLTGATAFVLLRLVWMSLLIFFMATALLVMLDLDQSWLPAVIFGTTGIAVLYSSFGGLRAVVITDAVQSLLLFSGAVSVLVVISCRMEGIGWVPVRWNDAWDSQPFFRFDPTVRVTVFGTVLNGLLYWMCTAGSDQTAVQRFMATRDVAAGRRSLLTNLLAGGAVGVILSLVGFAILDYFQRYPERLPHGKTIAGDADALFPFFIVHELPVGLTGLVVAGMFAAAMSSIDSGVNSITAVVMTDFVQRFRTSALTRSTSLRASAGLALLIGVIVAAAGTMLAEMSGNFLEISQRLLNLFLAPLFVLFCFGLFITPATPGGALAGVAASLSATACLSFWTSLTGLSEISFQWINPIGLLTGIGVGWIVSLWTPRRDQTVPGGVLRSDASFRS